MKIKIVIFFYIFCSFQLYSQEITNNKIIPIEYRGHIYIKGMVENKEGYFVFDTGANNLYFDSLFYNNSNFNYDSIAMAKLPGAGKEPQKVKVIINTVIFNFGDFIYKTKIVPVLSLKTILGDFADGIIGLDYFSNKSLEINYKQNYMKIYDKIDSTLVLKYNKIQCENFKNKLYVPITFNVNDTISITDKFILDLGSGGSITLNRPIAIKYNLNNNIINKAKYYTKYGGVGGESESYSFVAKSIDIGWYNLKYFEANYSTDESGALSSTQYAGLLGNEILERFDVIIDFATNCLYLKPNIAFADTFKFSKLGFRFVDRSKTLGAFIVTGFYENSQAEKSGLQIDDRIIEINDMSVKNMDYQQQQNYINKTNKLILKVERATEQFNFEIIQSQILKNE